MIEAGFWIAVGIVLKVLVPMPWADDRIRRWWAALRNWVASKV